MKQKTIFRETYQAREWHLTDVEIDGCREGGVLGICGVFSG